MPAKGKQLFGQHLIHLHIPGQVFITWVSDRPPGALAGSEMLALQGHAEPTTEGLGFTQCRPYLRRAGMQQDLAFDAI